MRVLYISSKHDNNTSKGKISGRNLSMLKKYFGEDNTFEYEIIDTSHRVIQYLHFLLLHVSGVGFSTEKKLQKFIDDKDIDCVFSDTSIFGIFSKSFIKRNNYITFFHNVESVYYDQCQGNSPKGKYLRFAIKFVEERNCLCSSVNITLNKRDSDGLKKLYGREADVILPSSMDDMYREYDEEDLPCGKEYLLFVGSNFFGNTDGLFDFIEECLPYIKSKLLIVGNGMDSYEERFSTDKVEFRGFVENLGPYYAGAKAVVLPIISGSGMKTKTCESLMHGKIIFGTDEAFEGFDYLDETDCVRCNSHKEFVEKINSYLEQEGDIKYFSQKSRNVFKKYYSNDAVYSIFKDGIDKAFRKGR